MPIIGRTLDLKNKDNIRLYRPMVYVWGTGCEPPSKATAPQTPGTIVNQIFKPSLRLDDRTAWHYIASRAFLTKMKSMIRCQHSSVERVPLAPSRLPILALKTHLSPGTRRTRVAQPSTGSVIHKIMVKLLVLQKTSSNLDTLSKHRPKVRVEEYIGQVPRW